MNRTRRRLTVAAASAAVLLTAGCSSAPAESDTTTITFAMWDEAQRPIYEKMFDAFEEANPEYSVQIQVTPWDNYWTKLQTAASGGSTADVFWMNGANFPLYASSGIISPISDRQAESGFDDSALPAGLKELYSWEGELYTLPNNFDTVAVWYNEALFDSAGLPYPDEDWTWADYQAIATQLTDASAGVWGTAAQLSEHTAFYNTIYQAGGYPISEDGRTAGYDDPKTQQGLQFWVDLLSAGSSPSLAQMADTDIGELFLSGKIAMIYNGSWNALTFSNSELGKAGSIGVAPMPAGPEGNASIIHGIGNVLSAKATNPDAAYKLIEYLGSEDAARIYTENGVGFAGYSSTDKAIIDRYADVFDLTPFAEAAADGIPFPRSKNSQAWMDLQVDYLTPVWALQESVEQGSARLQTAMQEELDSE